MTLSNQSTLKPDLLKNVENYNELKLPRTSSIDSSVKLVANNQADIQTENNLKNSLQKALNETRPSEIGTANDKSLRLMGEKLNEISNKDPKIDLKFDNDLKSRLDQLTETMQNGGSIQDIQNFQAKEMNLASDTQIESGKQLLEIAKKISDPNTDLKSLLPNRDIYKTILSTINDTFSETIEPSENQGKEKPLLRDEILKNIQTLNNAIADGKTLKTMQDSNPDKKLRISEDNGETIQTLLTLAKEIEKKLPSDTTKEARDKILTPILEAIGNSLLR